MSALSTNTWDHLSPPEPGRWSPRLRASVIIPYFEALAALRRTLLGVFAQTYPRELFEVIVVDDGSPTHLRAPDIDDLGQVTVITRPDEGFRLATARNRGTQDATGSVLVFLDGDMIPDPAWLEHHLRWHHTTPDALVVGFRDHIDDSWLTEDIVKAAMNSGGIGSATKDCRVERPEWIEFHMRRTKDLTTADTDLFRVVTGGNMSISRSMFEDIGGFDDTFTRWGGEDTELGYRAWIAGALLIPERGAHCWHQGLGTTPDVDERLAQVHQSRKLAHLIPDPSMRKPSPGRQWQRPRVATEVGVGETEHVAATIQALLACDDLEVVVTDLESPEIGEDFGPDPRVHITDRPETVSRFSPLRCVVPAGRTPDPTLVEQLAQTALRHGRARTVDGIEMTSVRHAARGEAGEGPVSKRSRRVRRPPSAVTRVAARAGRIRSWSDARAAARWVAAATLRRARIQRGRDVVTRPLEIDPWSRVYAPGYSTLPASGAPDGRLDLVVTTDPQSAPDGVPTLVPDEHEDAPLLTYPPLDHGEALSILRGERDADSPLTLMLAGVAPDRPPPGPRSGSAWSFLSSSEEIDDAGLEAVRRSVLIEHLDMARLDQIRSRAGLASILPLASIVLCTRRPDRAMTVIERMLDQSYSHIQIVIVAHGADPAPLTRVMERGEIPHHVTAVGEDVPFGAALALGTRHASGDLILKVDDDDLYSPTHVEDLVLAWLMSRADIVGKAAEFVLFSDTGEVIHRFRGGAYTASRTLAGGALAITRAAYTSVGGWRPLARHVDKALIDDVTAMGGTTFRTHGLGYVLVRHDDHTWETDDRRFTDQAEERWSDLPEWVLESPVGV